MRRFNEKARDYVQTIRGAQASRVGDIEPHVVGGSDNNDEVKIVQKNVDRKGKGKMDLSEDIGLSYCLQPPSFDLRIGYTQHKDVHSENI
ncbi:Hypothetical predicted protein [Olea europaea subsp. europaea]|uniref:Uncharacterized protein n=1 Tax=Olea europaea subsp. europaea TaxID=158383 RepID=A0A8S0UUJ6_OLEEU|nr:Hypothetical predicted protein [Olea europaea subsp. europaea]